MLSCHRGEVRAAQRHLSEEKVRERVLRSAAAEEPRRRPIASFPEADQYLSQFDPSWGERTNRFRRAILVVVGGSWGPAESNPTPSAAGSRKSGLGDEAVEDAERCVARHASWWKGRLRLRTAREGRAGKADDAAEPRNPRLLRRIPRRWPEDSPVSSGRYTSAVPTGPLE
jgi:hypothetical protein